MARKRDIEGRVGIWGGSDAAALNWAAMLRLTEKINVSIYVTRAEDGEYHVWDRSGAWTGDPVQGHRFVGRIGRDGTRSLAQ